MTSILELSYNHLPPHLKQCFSYSSLFPKQKRIKTNELIKQWIAQGFIESSNGGKSMEDIGKDYFKELCWRFFYENSSDEYNFDDRVHMHDVVRELAKKVAGKKLYVRGNPNNDYVVSEQTRHISFDYVIISWQDVLSKLRKAKGLRTFLLLHPSYERNFMVNKTVLDELFSSFPRLRVLGLYASDIYKVPNSIRKLRHLRYLDLSRNDMKLLPNSITELQNLQRLKLTRCFRLKKLPRDTNNLVNLRHLDFYDGKIRHMPEGMEKLTCLQTLSLFVLDCKRLGKLSELNKINNLNGRSLRIIGLERLRSTSSEVSSVNLKGSKDLRDLTLGWKSSQDECEAESDERIMEGLEPHPNVEILRIDEYNGVGLPNWVSCSLLKLTKITIANCHRLQHLPQFSHLEALEFLYLKDLRCLKFIDKNDPYSSSMFFPSLKKLFLEDMPNLEGWWELGESRVGETENKCLPPTFPRLENLSICHCPKLTSIPKLSFRVEHVSLCNVGVEMMSTVGPLWCLRALRLGEMKDLKYQDSLSRASTMSRPDAFQQYQVSLSRGSTMSWPDELFQQNQVSLSRASTMSLRDELFQQNQVSLGAASAMSSPEEIFQQNQVSLGAASAMSSPEELFQQNQVSLDTASAMSSPEPEELFQQNQVSLDMASTMSSLEVLFQQNPVSLGTASTMFSPVGLVQLEIEECPNLMSLPEWIGNLTFLKKLKIIGCPKLKSLPEEMRQLKYLKYLTIKGCPEVAERCKEGGEDWPKISHVPNVTL